MRARRNRIRQWAKATLALWLGSWALVVLDPCCEALAGALHDHDDSAYVHAHDTSATTTVHHHCESAPVSLDHQPVPAGNGDASDRGADGKVAGASYPWPAARRGAVRGGAVLEPPSSPPCVYLITSRLRL